MAPPSVEVTPRLATFFSVYPEPLGPSGAHVVLPGGEMRGFASLQEIVIHYDGEAPYLKMAPLSARTPFVSVRFHRGQRRYSMVTENLEEVVRVVRRVAPALGGEQMEPTEAELEDRLAAYTVVEMVTPLIRPIAEDVWVPAPPDDECMGPNLTRCIEGLLQIVTAYRLVEGLSIPTPARERLGPAILSGTRPANPTHGGWEGIACAVLNTFAIPGRHSMPPPPSANVAAKIQAFFIQRRMDHPVTAVLELQADANTALHQYGDFRTAVLLAFTASEVLLDATLMALVWEEGMTPEQAAGLFYPQLLTRVRTLYHDRLGGNWTTAVRRSPVGKWYADCVLLRHKVAHAGVQPDRALAEEALGAYVGLQKHVLDRLTASIGRYPAAAPLLLSEPALRRRAAWTRRAREVTENVTFETFARFNHWRDSVLALRVSAP